MRLRHLAACAALLLLAGAQADAVRLPRPWDGLQPGREAPHAAAEILSVPGYDRETLPSRQYGGYITVDEEAGRRL